MLNTTQVLILVLCVETSLTGLKELCLSPASSGIGPLNFHVQITRIRLLARTGFTLFFIGVAEKQQKSSTFKKRRNSP